MGKKFLFTTFSLLSILMLLVMTAGTPLSAAMLRHLRNAR